MTLSVEQCKNYDGFKCKKCERLLPDVCADQETLEAKAAAFDAWQATQAPTAPPVAPEAPVKRKGRPPKHPTIHDPVPTDVITTDPEEALG